MISNVNKYTASRGSAWSMEAVQGFLAWGTASLEIVGAAISPDGADATAGAYIYRNTLKTNITLTLDSI